MTRAAPGAAVRAGAARVVRAVRFDGASLKAALPPAFESLADPRDRALGEAMGFEACRWALRYERLLALMMPRPLPASLRDVHALLLVGFAQLDAMKLAEHAAISTTAEAARVLGHPRHVGLVNAILRRFLRERATLDAALRPDPVGEHAHPAWLVEAFRRDWPGRADAMLREGNRAAPVWLRVNPRRGTTEGYAQRLRAQGLECDASALAPQALRLERGVAPTRLPGWAEGDVSVQDLAAQLSVAALASAPGQRVLDACAAPGGKSAHLLETEPSTHLLALDLDPRRLRRIRDNLGRLGLEADVRTADAATPADWFDGERFDRILLDAPCSGTGVIRRQPDIKLHRRASDITGLVALQARLLDALWPLLAPGGRLVYATCSVLKDENERQIHAFLARTPAASPIALDDRFGEDRGTGRQRFPGDDDSDGFFYAALGKPD